MYRSNSDLAWTQAHLSSRADAAQVIEPVLAAMHHLDYSSKDILAMHITLEEAIVNALRHGNHDDPSKQVVVRYQVTWDCALAEVEDQGHGFDPRGVPDPLALVNMERPSGRGLLLMRSLMTWVRFNACGNRVSFCRLRGQAAQDSLRLAGGSSLNPNASMTRQA